MDWRAKFIPVAYGKMYGTPQDVQDKYWNELCDHNLRLLDKLLASSAKTGEWFAGAKPTIADVAVWDTMDSNLAKRADVLDKYPALRSSADRFAALPGIAATWAAVVRLNTASVSSLLGSSAAFLHPPGKTKSSPPQRNERREELDHPLAQRNERREELDHPWRKETSGRKS